MWVLIIVAIVIILNWQHVGSVVETVLHGMTGATMPSRWRDAATYCSDFDKVTLNFAGHTITVNRAYREKFIALATFIDINPEIRNHVSRVDSFACRTIGNTSSTWSYHSYGQAIDINPEDFPAGSNRYTLPNWYTTLLSIARTLGFRAGADWQSYYDPMHLEIGNRLPR